MDGKLPRLMAVIFYLFVLGSLGVFYFVIERPVSRALMYERWAEEAAMAGDPERVIRNDTKAYEKWKEALSTFGIATLMSIVVLIVGSTFYWIVMGKWAPFLPDR